ncbi:MAG: YfhO family protein [Culturomica sp.]|jgi:hypothetical protein|nr:YfhO family protein [Culturomica sp.]
MYAAVLKRYLPHLKAIVVFVLISFLYFSPGIFEGKTVLGSDSRSGVGNEINEYRKETGETSRWTNSLFSGMPAYQITLAYAPLGALGKIKRAYDLYIPAPASYLFVMMLGFYILLVVIGARTDTAILGAIGYAFSSYFLILIEAGHIWKLLTLAYIPPTMAGIVLAYRGKYVTGLWVTSLFLTFQLSGNHIQMIYYFMFVILVFVVYKFVESLKNRTIPQFFKASAVCGIAALIALSVNLSNLYHTWEYSKETIRGKSELTQDLHNKTESGLDRDYMVGWSYGIGETWTLLIPDAKGGGSGYIGNRKAVQDVSAQLRQAIAQQNQYWGDMPFTEGPVYAGAFFMMLFVLSFFLLKSRFKWYMLALTVLIVLLSWGKHFMGLTNLFADYVPMYSKFRAVSSILVVVEFIVPLMAVLALMEIVKDPRVLVEKKRAVWISAGLTGGLTFLFILLPRTFFDFLSTEETHTFFASPQNPQMGAFITALEDVRISIFKSDAWRSVIIIAIGCCLLWFYARQKLKTNIFVLLVTLLCLGDLWMVDKRYLNSDSEISRQQVKNYSSFFPQTAADIEILKDSDPHYRVFNATVNSFNDGTTSYYHKSVGGYHAAKLKRYQDLIEYHLSKGNRQVFNMLNTKYFIVPGADKRPVAQLNPEAMGNAWFVDSVKWVDNADEEIAALNDFEPASVAVIDKRFYPELGDKPIARDTNGSIRLTSYKPNELQYASRSSSNEFAVFSEVFYGSGWKATIDGEEVPIVRVNYILRGIYVPAGMHEIVMTFKPASLKVTEGIGTGGLVVLFLLTGVVIFRYIKKSRNG